jgi:hypothetical protein
MSDKIAVYIIVSGQTHGPIESVWSTPQAAIDAREELLNLSNGSYSIVVRIADESSSSDLQNKLKKELWAMMGFSEDKS